MLTCKQIYEKGARRSNSLQFSSFYDNEYNFLKEHCDLILSRVLGKTSEAHIYCWIKSKYSILFFSSIALKILWFASFFIAAIFIQDHFSLLLASIGFIGVYFLISSTLLPNIHHRMDYWSALAYSLLPCSDKKAIQSILHLYQSDESVKEKINSGKLSNFRAAELLESKRTSWLLLRGHTK